MSVVVITGFDADEHERLRNVECSLRALWDQSLNRNMYELIVVDQGPTPSPNRSFLEYYATTYRHIYNPAVFCNRSWAMNVGARLSDPASRCLVFASADYLAHRGLMEIVFTAINAGFKGGLPFVWALMLGNNDETNKAIAARFARDDGVPRPFSGTTYENAPGLCYFIDRKLYFDIGGHNENFEGHGPEDREFWYRVQKRIRLHRMDEEIAIHMWHPPARDIGARDNNVALIKKILAGETVWSPTDFGDPDKYRRQLKEIITT